MSSKCLWLSFDASLSLLTTYIYGYLKILFKTKTISLFMVFNSLAHLWQYQHPTINWWKVLYSKYTTEERIFEKSDTLNRTLWDLWTNKTKNVWIFCLSSLFDIFIWYKPTRPFPDAKKMLKDLIPTALRNQVLPFSWYLQSETKSQTQLCSCCKGALRELQQTVLVWVPEKRFTF